MKNGFVTLHMVIILGSITLALSLALSVNALWAIQDGGNTKKSAQGRSLVSACAEVALEALRENNTYTGTDTLALGKGTCTYTVTDTGGTTRSVVAASTVGDVVRKVNVSTSAFNPIIITAWQEVP